MKKSQAIKGCEPMKLWYPCNTCLYSYMYQANHEPATLWVFSLHVIPLKVIIEPTPSSQGFPFNLKTTENPDNVATDPEGDCSVQTDRYHFQRSNQAAIYCWTKLVLLKRHGWPFWMVQLRLGVKLAHCPHGSAVHQQPQHTQIQEEEV